MLLTFVLCFKTGKEQRIIALYFKIIYGKGRAEMKKEIESKVRTQD